MMNSINDIVDYIIDRFERGGKNDLTMLKLQKLLYYAQAYYLANYNKPLFDEEFQAWVHGPVNREIFDRFKETHSLYSITTCKDLRMGFDEEVLAKDDREYIDDFLNSFGHLSGADLEVMSHNDAPWIKARNGLKPLEECENVIPKDEMLIYYANFLEKESV